MICNIELGQISSQLWHRRSKANSEYWVGANIVLAMFAFQIEIENPSSQLWRIIKTFPWNVKGAGQNIRKSRRRWGDLWINTDLHTHTHVTYLMSWLARNSTHLDIRGSCFNFDRRASILFAQATQSRFSFECRCQYCLEILPSSIFGFHVWLSISELARFRNSSVFA